MRIDRKDREEPTLGRFVAIGIDYKLHRVQSMISKAGIGHGRRHKMGSDKGAL